MRERARALRDAGWRIPPDFWVTADTAVAPCERCGRTVLRLSDDMGGPTYHDRDGSEHHCEPNA